MAKATENNLGAGGFEDLNQIGNRQTQLKNAILTVSGQVGASQTPTPTSVRDLFRATGEMVVSQVLLWLVVELLGGLFLAAGRKSAAGIPFLNRLLNETVSAEASWNF